MAKGQEISYEIDHLDRIRALGGQWAEFAQANGGEHLGENLLGSSLWNSIQCVDLITIYRPLLKHVRESGMPLSFPIHCNSPTHLRELEMTLIPLEGGGIEFRTVVLRERPRPSPAHGGPAGSVVGHVMDLCDWCLSMRPLQEGLWVSAVEAVRNQGLLRLEHTPHIRRTVCRPCRNSLDHPKH